MLIPLFMEQLLSVLVGVADTFMVSYAGEAAVSGVSLVNMFNTVFLFLFSALFSLVLMVVILLLNRRLLGLLFGEVEEDVMEACVTYLRISAYSYPAIAIYNAGVAYPSLISRSFSGVVIIILCFKKSNEVYLVWRKILCWKGNMIRKILGIAVPNGIENGLFQLLKVALSSITALFGTVQRSPEFLVRGCPYGDSSGPGFYHSYRSVYGSRRPAGGRLLYEKTSADHFPGFGAVERIDPADIPSCPSGICPVSSGEKTDLCPESFPTAFGRQEM